MTDSTATAPAAPVPASHLLAEAKSQGMQWLVMGMAPGVEFYAGFKTRAEANQYINDAEMPEVRHGYYVVIKARDLYAI